MEKRNIIELTYNICYRSSPVDFLGDYKDFLGDYKALKEEHLWETVQYHVSQCNIILKSNVKEGIPYSRIVSTHYHSGI